MHYLTVSYSKSKEAWILTYAGRVLGVYSRRGDAEAEARKFKRN